MITYGIGVLRVFPLISELREAHTRVTELWYTDDARAWGTFHHILAHFWDMQARGPPRGYFPDPTKSILVVAPGNVTRAEDFLQGMVMQIVTGSRYLGGFIRDGAAEKSWLSGKFEVWAESVGTLAGVSRKHLQSAYAGLQKSFQQEWAFLHQVTPGI